MDENQIKALVDQLKATGLDEEDIMDVFYTTFSKGKMDRKDLETLAIYMGYELTDDFKNDPTPDPIEDGGEAPEGEDESVLEDAKALDEDESPEEFEEKIGDIKEGEYNDDEDEDEPEEDEEDEDEEWDKAQKLFKI